MINYDYYLTTIAEFVEKRKNEFNLEYEKARNKNTVVANWIDTLRIESNLIQKEIFKNGLTDFKREWDEAYDLDSDIDEGRAFDQTIANCFPDLNIKQIGLISHIDALSELVIFIESNRINTHQVNFDNPRSVNKYWIGTEETEFVQLIYALIESDRLNEKEKTKMTQEIANFMGFPLSNDWQSKLSHSIHQANFYKKPKIFGDLEKAWEKYKDRQISKKLNS